MAPRPATLRRHDSLRAALIEAAERKIAIGGLGALRARTLAETVGCSLGAIYTIFPDLEGVILEVNARTLAEIDAAMAAAGGGPDPTRELVGLAHAYLAYAAANRARWAALFQFSLPAGGILPDWFVAAQSRAFSHIEAPLGRLRPHLPGPARVLLARGLFSAVHGMVALGLDEKVATMEMPVLSDQIGQIVSAVARGLVERS